jgi:2-C-methyl-D-erythritol 4-phosphate cytidylyltransferase
MNNGKWKMSCTAIVVAAGSSSRMGGKVRKPYLLLRQRPILAWTLAALAKLKSLRQIVLVTRPEDRRRAAEAAKLAKLPRTVRLDFADGGARRQDSVFNGMKASDRKSELILIHDAARPFPHIDAMDTACERAMQDGAAILATRVKDTVKRAAVSANEATGAVSTIEMTIPRDGLWLAQTPQIFRRKLILKLFERIAEKPTKQEFTDDASICEHYGVPVALIESSDANIKVTRPEDLVIAEALLKLKSRSRK